MYEQIAANKRRSWLIIAFFVLLVGGVVLAINFLLGYGVVGFVFAALIAIGSSVFAYYNSDKVALRMSRAYPADPQQYARYHNLVEGLCIASGLPKPRLYIHRRPRTERVRDRAQPAERGRRGHHRPVGHGQ